MVFPSGRLFPAALCLHAFLWLEGIHGQRVPWHKVFFRLLDGGSSTHFSSIVPQRSRAPCQRKTCAPLHHRRHWGQGSPHNPHARLMLGPLGLGSCSCLDECGWDYIIFMSATYCLFLVLAICLRSPEERNCLTSRWTPKPCREVREEDGEKGSCSGALRNNSDHLGSLMATDIAQHTGALIFATIETRPPRPVSNPGTPAP